MSQTRTHHMRLMVRTRHSMVDIHQATSMSAKFAQKAFSATGTQSSSTGDHQDTRTVNCRLLHCEPFASFQFRYSMLVHISSSESPRFRVMTSMTPKSETSLGKC